MTAKRVDMIELERMKSLDPTLQGTLSSKASFLLWIRCAVRNGDISQDANGFFLSPEQAAYWKNHQP